MLLASLKKFQRAARGQVRGNDIPNPQIAETRSPAQSFFDEIPVGSAAAEKFS